jgi:hypothetical protein
VVPKRSVYHAGHLRPAADQEGNGSPETCALFCSVDVASSDTEKRAAAFEALGHQYLSLPFIIPTGRDVEIIRGVGSEICALGLRYRGRLWSYLYRPALLHGTGNRPPGPSTDNPSDVLLRICRGNAGMAVAVLCDCLATNTTALRLPVSGGRRSWNYIGHGGTGAPSQKSSTIQALLSPGVDISRIPLRPSGAWIK